MTIHSNDKRKTWKGAAPTPEKPVECLGLSISCPFSFKPINSHNSFRVFLKYEANVKNSNLAYNLHET